MLQMPGVEDRVYKVVTRKGLDKSLPAYKLYRKAKKLGVWDPEDIDLEQDKKDWAKLTDVEKDYLLGSVVRFDAGEEAVSEDLLPLIAVMAREGRFEDEMYLSTFLFEEVKHADFFRLFIDEVVKPDRDLSDMFSPAYSAILMEELPKVMGALWTDASPKAQLNASITYNMMVEGVLAETGYYGFYQVLDKYDILPGLRKGVSLIQRDESRHIGYGVYLISRLVAKDPSLLDYVTERMEELNGMITTLLEEGAKRYDDMEVRPFGMERGFTQAYAAERFHGRMQVIMRSAGKSQTQVNETDYEFVGSLAGSSAEAVAETVA